ncbi:lytic transglycosylase domain-containing protein [Actinoplanes nipponensis]|uniref:lytic transglycosylase domain-containing protein n=1 Tax=Actinoplanes nipponensis TaxID=135950 RepID=UPI001942A19F|nr:hypothetical protein [Actinoplanes nipponensis]
MADGPIDAVGGLTRGSTSTTGGASTTGGVSATGGTSTTGGPIGTAGDAGTASGSARPAEASSRPETDVEPEGKVGAGKPADPSAGRSGESDNTSGREATATGEETGHAVATPEPADKDSDKDKSKNEDKGQYRPYTSDMTPAADKQFPGGDESNKSEASDQTAKSDKLDADKNKAEKQAAAAAKASPSNKDQPASTSNSDKKRGTTDKAAAENTSDDPGKAQTKGKTEPTPPTAAALAAASQGRATRVLRRANPVRVARSTARTTSAWAKRPSGRLILPALIAVLLLGAAGTAGAYLVPQALQSVPSPSATPGFGQDAGLPSGPPSSFGGLPPAPGASAPVVGGTLPGAPPAVGGARPADVLASWAQQTGTRAGIPVVAVQAYGYAELVVGRTTPSCHLSWTTIAAIAKVESAHGSANGAVLNVDGSVAPPIFGLALDGKGGRQEVRDTDRGALDGDPQFDRAMGPLQFIPQTWAAVSAGNGVDADNNGVSDPHDIDDASLAAAKYLCQGGRDLAKPDAWWDAILSYNALRPYAQKVFDAANDYGQRSRV